MGLFVDPQLSDRESLAFAGRAQVLPVSGRPRHAVLKSQLRKNGPQILHVHLGGVALAAAYAVRARVFRARILVELDAQLGGPLKDVEEFPEWQKEQRRDYRNGVQDGK